MEIANTSPVVFLQSLRQSQLVSESALKSFLEQSQQSFANSTELARVMVRAELITRFQSRHLLAGRWRGLAFGDYQVLDSLSVGGMGEIFSAKQVSTNRQVAIKVLRQRYRENRKISERFRLEAKLLTSVSHPNLLHGIEEGTFHDDQYHFSFVCTDLVAGPNLFEWLLLKRRIPWQWACEVIRQAALGLHFVHELGFVHRDVKPGNLILAPDGVVKVIDFGIALYNGHDPQFIEIQELTRATKHYVAPEQTHPDIDARVDIFGLGKSLFLALSGKTPSENVDFSWVRHTHPDLPAEVEQIFRRMTADDPRSRFGSMQDVADSLAPLGQPYQLDLDFQALLEARHRARRQRQRGESQTRVESNEEINAKKSTDELPVDDLVEAAARQLSTGHDNNLAALRELAEARRSHAVEVRQLNQQLAHISAEVEQYRKGESEALAEAKTGYLISEQRNKQQAEQLVQLQKSLAGFRQSLGNEQALRMSLQDQLVKLELSLEETRKQLASITARAGWLTEQILMHRSLPVNGKVDTDAEFWEAYENACRNSNDEPFDQAFAEDSYLDELGRSLSNSSKNGGLST